MIFGYHSVDHNSIHFGVHGYQTVVSIAPKLEANDNTAFAGTSLRRGHRDQIETGPASDSFIVPHRLALMKHRNIVARKGVCFTTSVSAGIVTNTISKQRLSKIEASIGRACSKIANNGARSRQNNERGNRSLPRVRALQDRGQLMCSNNHVSENFEIGAVLVNVDAATPRFSDDIASN
jgi:hypothetical protein